MIISRIFSKMIQSFDRIFHRKIEEKFYVFEKIQNNYKTDGIIVSAGNNLHCALKLIDNYHLFNAIDEIVSYVVENSGNKFQKENLNSPQLRREYLSEKREEIFNFLRSNDGWTLHVIDNLI